MPNPESILPTIVFLPFAAAALALVIGRFTGQKTGWLMVATAAASFGLSLGAFTDPGVAPTVFNYAWIPDLGINLTFRGDAFGLFFACLVSGIGLLVGIYSTYYIPKLDNARVGRYYAALIAFMGAMLGIALSDDMIQLFVFWEITSITSFMLIGFWYEEDVARKGAWTALQVTALGGLAMMVGFVMIGVVTGTFSISGLADNEALKHTLAASPLFFPALLLILGGAFTKSAQVPFHFWLPGAMVAPTPVSTYLHAATMVKAGIFLVGRMLPIFSSSAAWSPILITFGLVTFVLGAYQAFRETDLKAILARTTLSTLGLVMMVYGLKAADQDAIQILNHAVYKGALFLVVGIVEHFAHTRDLTKLGGLKKDLPITFWLCVLAGLSMAGLPPFLGFVAKESLYTQLLENEVVSGGTKWLVIAASVTANAFVFAVSFKVIIGVFLGAKPEAAGQEAHGHGGGEEEHAGHGEHPGLWLSPAVLAAIAVGLGLASVTDFTHHLINRLSSAGAAAEAHATLIPSLSHPGPLLLSLATIGLGIFFYRQRVAVNGVQERVQKLVPAMQDVWDRVMHAVTTFAEGFSSRWQNGSLRWYFTGILSFTVGLSLWGLWRGGITLGHVKADFTDAPLEALALCVLLVITTFMLVRSKTRLGAAIASTAIGFLVALVYVVYSSPDIVLTQILIETVSTIFLLLVLFFMPAFKKESIAPLSKAWQMGLSAVVGVTVTLFVLLSTGPFKTWDNLAADYLTRSYSQANGHNAVNVIIVDFRAMDTTGEITVLVVVGLCVYGLLRARRKAS
jgi:multicomponent Na+:H+ antiporter subunit A